MSGLIIVGFGGQGRMALGIARELRRKVVSFVNALDTDCPKEVSRVPVQQTIEEVPGFRNCELVIALGDNRRKKELALEYSKMGLRFTSLISPSAHVALTASIGKGSIVAPLSMIGEDSRIGDHVKIDSGCMVSHDSHVAQFASLAPGVDFGGFVTVEEGAFLGLGAVVYPRVRIGAWSLVGMGAVVIRDVPGGVTVFGNPARIVSR